jgi:hypothetical protein
LQFNGIARGIAEKHQLIVLVVGNLESLEFRNGMIQ